MSQASQTTLATSPEAPRKLLEISQLQDPAPYRARVHAGSLRRRLIPPILSGLDTVYTAVNKSSRMEIKTSVIRLVYIAVA